MISVAASVKRLVHPRNQTGRGIAAAGPEASCRSVDGAPLIDRFAQKGKPAVRCFPVEHHTCRQLSNRRPVLETVARSTAGNPYVVVAGMTIDQKVASRGVLIGTDPRLDNGRTGQ